jgi:hypothetical protein
MLLSIVVKLKFQIHQIDVQIAYIYIWYGLKQFPLNYIIENNIKF